MTTCKECLIKKISSYVIKSRPFFSKRKLNNKYKLQNRNIPKTNCHKSSLDLIQSIISFHFNTKHTLNSYHTTLIAPKIGTTSDDMIIQLNSITSCLLNQTKSDIIYKRPLIKQHSFDNYNKSNSNNNNLDNNVNYKTLDNISVNSNTNILNRTIDSSLNKYQISVEKNYDEKSLAEYLNDEIKNIKHSKNKTHTSFTMNSNQQRPLTPINTKAHYDKDPSILLDYNKEDDLQLDTSDTKINILNNKNINNKKNVHIKLNTYNNKTTYRSFRTGSSKPQNLKNIVKNRKQDSLVPLKKQKEISNVQVYDYNKYGRGNNNSSNNNKIIQNKKNVLKGANHSNSNSFYRSPYTPRKENKRSFISNRSVDKGVSGLLDKHDKMGGSFVNKRNNVKKESMNQSGMKSNNSKSNYVVNKKSNNSINNNINNSVSIIKKGIGNKVNITIDIRDLMKDDYEETFLKEPPNTYNDTNNQNINNNEAMIANGKDNLDNIIISQKQEVNGISNNNEI